jgi:environmental stress-induced protein Ves
VDDEAESVDRFAGDQDVEADQVGRSVADFLVVERGIPCERLLSWS